MSGSDGSFLDEDNTLKIQFHSGNTAEALDKRKFGFEPRQEDMWTANEDLWWTMDDVEEMNDGEEDIGDQQIVTEELLRIEFENEVNNRIPEVKEILPWDQLTRVYIMITLNSYSKYFIL